MLTGIFTLGWGCCLLVACFATLELMDLVSSKCEELDGVERPRKDAVDEDVVRWACITDDVVSAPAPSGV